MTWTHDMKTGIYSREDSSGATWRVCPLMGAGRKATWRAGRCDRPGGTFFTVESPEKVVGEDRHGRERFKQGRPLSARTAAAMMRRVDLMVMASEKGGAK